MDVSPTSWQNATRWHARAQIYSLWIKWIIPTYHVLLKNVLPIVGTCIREAILLTDVSEDNKVFVTRGKICIYLSKSYFQRILTKLGVQVLQPI